MSRYAYVIVQMAGFLINRNTLVIAHKSERDPRCAQDDKPLAVILSAARIWSAWRRYVVLDTLPVEVAL